MYYRNAHFGRESADLLTRVAAWCIIGLMMIALGVKRMDPVRR